LRPVVRQRSFKAGDLLAREGQLASSVFVVKLGSVIGYRWGLDGHTRPIGMSVRGAAFGLFGFFGQSNAVSVVTGSAGRLCEVAMDDLRLQSLRSEFVKEKIIAAFRGVCSSIAAWSEGMRVPGVRNQLGYMMLLLSEEQGASVIELPPQTAIAELLGTTRETVARALAALENEGAIRRLERKKCEVCRGALMKRLNKGAGRTSAWAPAPPPVASATPSRPAALPALSCPHPEQPAIYPRFNGNMTVVGQRPPVSAEWGAFGNGG
jgi:CRP-like cAMP-binding protein